MTKSKIFKRLYKDYSKKHLNKIILSGVFAILVAASTSSIAWLLDPAIKKLFIEKDQSLLILIPTMIIIAFCVKGMSLYFAKATMIGVGESVKKELQYDMVCNLVETDTQIIDKKHSGKFISNLTYDVTHITNLLSNAILTLFKDSLTLIGLLTVMFLQNWKLALISIVMIPLASFAAKTLGKRISKVTTEAQEKSGFLTTYLVELFKNHKLIKIFQKEEFEKKRADKYLLDLKEKNQKIQTVFVRMSPIMETLTGIMIALLIFYSGKLMVSGDLDINNFFSFLAAMMLAYQPVRSLATLNMGLNQGLAAAKRILPIIDNENKIKEIENSRKLNLKNGEIEFKNIYFKYNEDENDVLKNVDILIKGGEMTSLVGHSGAGKSSIMNLIPRLYDKTSGDILIDKQSIYDLGINSLRSNISLVTQDITLFDDTIKNNISYAKMDATNDEIYEAARLSHSEDFISKLPNKYETLIGENGVRLSGGEKQRISIARAILKKSKIILLDEATSSLDAETETKIQEAINLLTKNRTALVIAHRLSTVMNSNKIYVLERGKVVAEGAHGDLLNKSDIYKNFYEKQLRKN